MSCLQSCFVFLYLSLGLLRISVGVDVSCFPTPSAVTTPPASSVAPSPPASPLPSPRPRPVITPRPAPSPVAVLRTAAPPTAVAPAAVAPPVVIRVTRPRQPRTRPRPAKSPVLPARVPRAPARQQAATYKPGRPVIPLGVLVTVVLTPCVITVAARLGKVLAGRLPGWPR
ncbi:MAG TPA: hypothetical protein VF070_15420 [Streptosporangiaceae bacterium]